MNKEQLTVAQYAKENNLSVQTVYRMLEDGRLKGKKIGKIQIVELDNSEDRPIIRKTDSGERSSTNARRSASHKRGSTRGTAAIAA